MHIHPMKDELSATTYPGRGILLGKSGDGSKLVIAYFIMGRSENSRNRVFTAEGDGLKTKAFDESKMTDPSLIIYAPVRVLGDVTIVTNGDQTDTVYEGMQKGLSFEDALRTRTFEPDGPNYTPRISGLVEPKADRYRLSILKSANGDPSSVRRYFFDYSDPQAGRGHFIHTYQQDGDPLPSFIGEPAEVMLPDGDIDVFTAAVWDAIDDDNKVSLFTRFIDRKDGTAESRIVNKHA
ncbi:MAG: inosine monophosphate cyclohydrolase [Clostridiales bacterium]|nr:inosine monophosphate cyclohydrolase [Clostridiales bacterium]